MYELSKTHQGHTRDLRSLDCFKGVLVTGGSDRIMNIYQQQHDGYKHMNRIDIFEKNILCVRVNHLLQGPFILVGCADGKIFSFDQLGNPVYVYEHSSAICSIDFINAHHFVTGSWDGKAIVWSIAQKKALRSYDNHKHAVTVFYNQSTDEVVSGSQDKALNVWKWQNGQAVHRIENAHGDIIRQISKVDEVGFVTCSNDEMIKLWTSGLELIATYSGHSAFIFTVKAKELGFYVSGGEDKTIKIWKNEECAQTIQLPTAVWSIYLDENSDILAGCTDGSLRIFTTDQNRKASAHVLQAFNKESMQAISKKSGMSAQEIKKLPLTSQMSSMSGKKDGEIRVFRNGTIPEAFMWQNGKWDKIGEVITEGSGGASGGTISQPKYYHGDKYFDAGEYDYIFDVDDQSGSPKIIPFNDGGNPLQAAEKYCAREGMSKGYIQQIRKFLMQNSSRLPRQVKKQEKKEFSPEKLICTPQTSIIQFSDFKNPKATFQKIKEFNEKVDNKLNQKELAHAQRIALLLENSSNYHAWTLDFKELDTLKKLLAWPKQYKFPVWDILRVFLRHYQSQTLFSGLEAGMDIIASLSSGLQFQFPQAIYGLILKTFCNMCIQNTNKGAVLKYSQIIFSSIRVISKRNLSNKNYLSAMANFLFNFSVLTIEKNVQQDGQMLKSFCQVLASRLEIDNNQENRTLMRFAAANVLYKHRDKVIGEMGFIKGYLGDDGVSKDLKMMLE